DLHEPAAAPVVRQDRRGLPVVDLQPLAQRLDVVVAARGAAVAGAFGRSRLDALDQHLVRHRDLDHEVQGQALALEQRIKRLGLRDGAREAVEDEALAAIRLLDALGDHLDHQGVGHQLPLVHDLPGLAPELAARGDGSAQHVTGRELLQAVLLLEDLRLGTLSGARWPQQDDVHPLLPLSFAFLIRPSYWCASRWLWICATVSIVTLTTISRLVPPK